MSLTAYADDVPSTAPATGYSGHGASSVAPELIAKYAAPTLPAKLRQKIQTGLDIRAPDAGWLTEDGKQLFFAWTVTGTPQIWRLDGPQRFPAQLTAGEESTGISAVFPDGSRLVVSRDSNGEENPGIYLLPATGGALETVFQKPGVQAHFGALSDDAKTLYFTANDRKTDAYAVYRYDLGKKATELLSEQPGLWNIADLLKTPSGDKLLIQKATGGASSEYWELDTATKALTPRLGVGETEDYSAVYGAHPGELIVRTNKLSNYFRIYRFSAKLSGKDLASAKNLLPISPKLPNDAEELRIDHARQRISYALNKGEYLQAAAIDAANYQPITVPRPPRAQSYTLAHATKNGRFSMITADTGLGPKQSYVLDWSTRRLTPWHSPSLPAVDPKNLVAASAESYPARDGTRIPMFVRRPPQCAVDGLCPVIVSFHGGPEGAAYPDFSTSAQLFVDAGFVYVAPNVRGSSGLGKAWLHADDGPKRLDVITDIEDCAKYIRAHWSKAGQEPKLGIAGGSYGGYSTLVGMTIFAGAFDSGVEIVGMSNLRTFLLNTAPYRRQLRITEYGDPDKDAEALAKLSPVNFIDRFKGQLLMIQGATDPRVPVGEALQFHDALAALGHEPELIIFPDEGHGARKRDNQVLQIGHMLQFFQKTLQPST